MPKYEYKVVPVPARCVPAKEADADIDPAVFTVETLLNDLGVAGWEYVRRDRMTLQTRRWPRRRETTQDMLIFRRVPVAHVDARPETAAGVEKVKARRVRRPELLAEAREGRRRITFEQTVDEPKAETAVFAAE